MRAAHLVSGSQALCGIIRAWHDPCDGLPSCQRCQKKAKLESQLASCTGDMVLLRTSRGRQRITQCDDCGLTRPVEARGLCTSCLARHYKDGTADEFGYVRAERLADYRKWRALGYSIREVASQVGISLRTAQRYEKEPGSG